MLFTAPILVAQQSPQPALQVREELRSILRNVPPQVGRVLRLDPTLLANDPYMSTYPSLGAYIKQHPEIQHNPGYFLGSFDSDEEGGYRAWREIMGDVAGFTIFLIVTGVVIWMIRTLVEQRRWNRLLVIQTEAHSKLLDRFTSNEELLAYLQTPAGRSFLEAAPNPAGSPRPIGAPLGRIFWSLQSGIVLIAGGIGFDVVSQRFPAPENAGLYAVGVIAMMVGAALVISAGVFYLISKRFGLWQPSVS